MNTSSVLLHKLRKKNDKLVESIKEMDIYVLILPLLIGWILDKLLGDPIGLPHLVVGFGKLISFCEKRWNCGTHRMLKGGVAAIMLILLVYAGSVLVLHYLFVLNRWLGIILSAVLVFYCLAGTTLINEVGRFFWLRIILWRKEESRFPVL